MSTVMDIAKAHQQSDRTMRILIGSAHPYLPQIHGGAQSSTHELVTALRRRGHDVAVLSGLTGLGMTGVAARLWLKLGQRSFAQDHRLGYPVYRAWFAENAAADVVRAFRPDVMLLQSGRPVQLAHAVRPTGVPTAIYFRNVETDDLGGPLDGLDGVRFLANSQFTAKHFARTDGIVADVIYPLIEVDRYRTDTQRRNVTFINPHPHKGVDIALAVARACPEIPFTFVRAWTLSEEDERQLQAAVAETPNITLRPATNDMRTVYQDARIVLAPSRWSEAFGRIAAEAHVNGIPVVASNRGGLPEAVGPGGIVLDPDGPIEAWVDAVRSLWHDQDHYTRCSDAARAHAGRKDMDADSQIDALAAFLAALVNKGAF
jgi:glycosyltransferase involved in cell wall biosynthesis